MAATTIGTTGTLFGIANAEAGVIIQSVDRASQRQKKEVMNQSGDIVAVGYFAPKAVYTVAGVLLWPNGLASGLSGIALSAYPGGVVALANVANDTSTTGGHVYCEEFTTRETSEDFAKFTGNMTQYPSITSP
jgi:hypothetical protein